MNQVLLEQRLAELPLYSYFFTSPSQLEFSPRVRWICEHEWAVWAELGVSSGGGHGGRMSGPLYGL